MPYLPKNPFSREDWFSELVRIDKDVKTTLKASYTNFQTKYSPQSMTKIQKVLTFFTTHTITAVVTASICLGGIATFAAQTTAPEQYKPSTVINNLFKNNKVQQSNPNTPLVSDSNNDVVSYEPCNISIKYPKQLAGEKILSVQPKDYNQLGDESIPNFYGVTIMSQKNFDYDYTTKINNLVSIGCSPTIIPPADNNLNSKMTIGELSELTGWFITSESKIEDIYTESQATAGPYRTIYFRFNNIYYRINFVTTKIPTNILQSQTTEVQGFWKKSIAAPGIFGDQIQIQFNNVAKNIPNTQVQNLNGVPTSGENFKYDLELATTGVGQYWELTDSKTNDKYIIKGDELNKKAEELSSKTINSRPNIPSNGVRTSGGLTYIFSGRVKDEDGIINTPNTYLITGIDKFEVKNEINIKLSTETTSAISQTIPNKENLKLTFVAAGPKPDTGFTLKSESNDTYYFPYSLNFDYDINAKSYNFSGEVILDPQSKYDNSNSFTVKSINKLDKNYEAINNKLIPNTEKTTLIKKENILLKKCRTSGPSSKFTLCTDDGDIYRFPNNFEQPNNDIVIFYGSVEIGQTGKDFDVVDGQFSTIRTDGPSGDKNNLKILGDLFIPKSQSVKDTGSQNEFSPENCNIIAGKDYANNANGQLFLTSAKNYINTQSGKENSSPQRLSELKKYISSGLGQLPIDAFHLGCGGFTSQAMKDLSYTNKNGRQVRAVLAAIGQEAISDPNLFVFVQEGDKLAMMTSYLYLPAMDKCRDFTYNGINPDVKKDQACSQDIIKNNPESVKIAQERLQSLLTSFEMD